METQDKTTTTSTPTKKTPTPRADQDQIIANRIAETRRKLNTVLADDALKARFAARGCDLAELNEGIAHCDATQAGYDARQVALGTEKAGYQALSDNCTDDFIKPVPLLGLLGSLAQGQATR